MARVKFPLKMADGENVRTLEELKEHFDLTSVLGYYDNGKLLEWLEDRYYEDEEKKIKTLDRNARDFKKCLCDILGADYPVDKADDVDLAKIADRNKRLKRLKEFTADDKILTVVDRVAFSQEDLADLLDKGVKEIYLCYDGEQFKIPGSKGSVTYIGVNNPKVKPPDGFVEKGIVFQGIDIGIDDIMRRAGNATDPVEAVNLWRMAAEQGNVEAQNNLGNAYYAGEGVGQDYTEAVKWFRKAAEQGYAEAQNALGVYYYEKNNNYEEATKWYLKAAEQGYEWAQYNIGKSYYDGNGVEQNYEKAINWWRKVTKVAQAFYDLAGMYHYGIHVGVDHAEAARLYHKAVELREYSAFDKLAELSKNNNDIAQESSSALEFVRTVAEQGDINAQFTLANLYQSGFWVKKNLNEAVKWWRKAAEQGGESVELQLQFVLNELEIQKKIEKAHNLQNFISAGIWHTVGLKSDGTVVAVGNNHDGECNVQSWRNIVAVSADLSLTLGLKSDGTVVAVGENLNRAGNVQDMKDIVAISSNGSALTVGLRSDGTITCVGAYYSDFFNYWKDIIEVSVGYRHAVGLKSDGTVFADNPFSDIRDNIYKDWKDIVAVSEGYDHTVGLKSDGTVVAVGSNKYGRCNVQSWRDIVAVSAESDRTVGLKSDGTVVAVGSNEYGQCNVQSWKDIVAVSVGRSHTVGLKSDGTVVAVGSNKYGQCNVQSWQDIGPAQK